MNILAFIVILSTQRRSIPLNLYTVIVYSRKEYLGFTGNVRRKRRSLRINYSSTHCWKFCELCACVPTSFPWNMITYLLTALGDTALHANKLQNYLFVFSLNSRCFWNRTAKFGYWLRQVCLSVRPYATHWLSPDGLSWSSTFGIL